MKKQVLIIPFILLSLAVTAQDKKNSPDSSSFRISTLFGCGHGGCTIPLGYFIQIDAGYTRFGHHNVFLPGLSGGLILNHNWALGGEMNFIGNPGGLSYHHTHTDSAGNVSKKHADLRGGYGGMLIQYTLFPGSRVHVAFPLMVGGGYLWWSDIHYKDYDGTIYHYQGHPSNTGSHFFVIEPGVKMELNLIKKLRLGLGISYRYAPDLDLKGVHDDFINQFNAKLSLSFGKF